jgi:hypothetical protein
MGIANKIKRRHHVSPALRHRSILNEENEVRWQVAFGKLKNSGYDL